MKEFPTAKRRDAAVVDEIRATIKTPATAGEYLDQLVLQWARPMSVSLIVIFGFFSSIELVALTGPIRPTELFLDVGVFFIGVLTAVSLWRRWVPAGMANLLVTAIILLAFANAGLNALLLKSVYSLKFVPFLIVVAGALLLSSRWLAICFVPILGVTIPIAWHLYSWEALLEIGPYFIAGSAIGFALHITQKRSHMRIYQLRCADAVIKEELKESLARTEKVLADYGRAEAHRRALESQLHQSQKMEAIGVLAGGIAHGMNNLLSAISAYASVVWDETGEEDLRRRDIEEILNAAKRGGQLTRNLLGFARKGKVQRVALDLNEIVEQTLKMIRATLPRNVHLDINLNDRLALTYGDPLQIGHALMNLFLNAADAMPNGGDLYVVTYTTEIRERRSSSPPGLPLGRYSVVRVSDTGMGMDEETRKQAFDPFFTTKELDKGTGLGLAMVYGTVRAHGGVVILESEVDRGTTVTLHLPVATDEQIAESPRKETPPSLPAVQVPSRVLLVDDEAIIRSSGQRLLRRLGCDVLLASNGEEALEIVRNHSKQIDLIILDLAMPKMDGVECFYKLREMDPHLPVIVSSGYADEGRTEKLVADGADGILPKPYDLDQMSHAIRSLGRGEREQET